MQFQLLDTFTYLPGLEVVKLDSTLQEIIIPRNSSVFLNLYSSRVQAGFPSPADSYVEKTLDLNEHLISHPAVIFFVRVAGDSMTGAGIHNNDMLVVDRSLKAKHGSIVIAVLNGDLTVKRLKIKSGIYSLMPENSAYRETVITEGMDFTVWGVVTSVVHQFI
jgi:DNA polymerase V